MHSTKTSMEHKNGGLENDFPFQNGVIFRFQPFKTPGHWHRLSYHPLVICKKNTHTKTQERLASWKVPKRKVFVENFKYPSSNMEVIYVKHNPHLKTSLLHTRTHTHIPTIHLHVCFSEEKFHRPLIVGPLFPMLLPFKDPLKYGNGMAPACGNGSHH